MCERHVEMVVGALVAEAGGIDRRVETVDRRNTVLGEKVVDEPGSS
jgi:hypothetical protein